MSRGVVIDFNANLTRFSAGIDKVTNDLNKFQSNANRISSQISKAFRFAGLGLGSAAIISFAKEIFTEFSAAEKAVRKLDTALSISGAGVKIARSELNKMADDLAKVSLFDDEQIRGGMATLLQFRGVQGDIFKEATVAALDFAEATGTDLPEAFTKMGKALSGSARDLRALKEVGVDITPAFTNAIKSFDALGDRAGKQRFILDALRKSIGGKAAGAKSGIVGATDDFAKSWNELQEAMGKAAFGNAGQGLSNMAKRMDQLKASLEGGWVGRFFSVMKFTNPALGLAAQFAGGGSSEPKNPEQSGKIRKAADPLAAEKDALDEFRENNVLNDAKAQQEIYDQQLAELKRFLKLKLISEEEYARRVAALKPKVVKDKDDPTKKLFENTLKGFESGIASESNLLKSRNHFIDLYNNQNLLSIKQFYAAKNVAQQENLDNSLALFDKEIAEIQSRMKKVGKVEGAELQKKISDILEDRADLIQANSEQAATSSLEEQQALKDYAEALEGVNAQILELTGNLKEAALVSFDAQNKQFRERLELEGNTAGLEQLNSLRKLIGVQADANELQREAGLITARLSNQEQRLQTNRESGAASELQNLQDVSKARSEAADQMESVVDAYEELAIASGNPQLLQDADNLKLALEELRASGDLLAKRFDTIFAETFSDAFSSFISGTQSMSDAFKTFVDSVVQQISRIAAQDLASKLFGSSGGSIGSFFSSLFGSATGGGSGGNVAPGIQLPKFAEGTNFVPRDMVAVIHRGEKIIPARFNNGTDMGRMSIINNFMVSGATDQRSQQQISAASYLGVMKAVRRNL